MMAVLLKGEGQTGVQMQKMFVFFIRDFFTLHRTSLPRLHYSHLIPHRSHCFLNKFMLQHTSIFSLSAFSVCLISTEVCVCKVGEGEGGTEGLGHLPMVSMVRRAAGIGWLCINRLLDFTLSYIYRAKKSIS